MPSQPLSQSSSLCLPLLKFSYATVSDDNVVPIPWIHLSSKNALFALFEKSPVQLDDGRTEERQKFKVLKDPEVMEEIDLDVLAVEARRVQSQGSNVSFAHIPIVAIIVKVPMIAIKYPLANGQIRRFQIRFGKNEDYYEAMKMLARANVPTVEAGTFPSLKPRIAPQLPPAKAVVPDDSASQIGLSNSSARNYNPDDALSAVSASRQAPRVLFSSGPAQPLPPSISAVEPRSAVESATKETGEQRRFIDQSTWNNSNNPPNLRAAYANSNVFLSTATTLVPGKQDSNYHSVQIHAGNMESIRQSTHLSLPHGASTSESLPQAVYDRLHEASELPTRNYQRPLARATAQNQTSIAQDRPRELSHDVDTGEKESPTKPAAKAKGKRGAATNVKKAPAAKKPRATASAKKKGPTLAKKSPVPTVEELLKEPGYSLLPDSIPLAARSRTSALKIDQHTGFGGSERRSAEIPESESEARLNNVVSPELGSVTTRRMTRSASQALSVLPPEAMNRQAAIIPSKSGPPPCTPADQIISNTSKPASPGHHAHTYPLKSMGPPLTQNHIPGPSTYTLPTAPDDPLLSMAQQCMATDANFQSSNADARLEAWNDLPIGTQITALHHYYCSLIMNDNFVELVKKTSLFWEVGILDGKADKWLMRGMPGEENVDEDDEL